MDLQRIMFECKFFLNFRNFDYNVSEYIDSSKPFRKEDGGAAEFIGEVYGVYGRF